MSCDNTTAGAACKMPLGKIRHSDTKKKKKKKKKGTNVWILTSQFFERKSTLCGVFVCGLVGG